MHFSPSFGLQVIGISGETRKVFTVATRACPRAEPASTVMSEPPHMCIFDWMWRVGVAFDIRRNDEEK